MQRQVQFCCPWLSPVTSLACSSQESWASFEGSHKTRRMESSKGLRAGIPLVASQQEAFQLKCERAQVSVEKNQKARGQLLQENRHFLYGRHLTPKPASMRSCRVLARKRDEAIHNAKSQTQMQASRPTQKALCWCHGRTGLLTKCREKACAYLPPSLLGLCWQNNFKLCRTTLVAHCMPREYHVNTLCRSTAGKGEVQQVGWQRRVTALPPLTARASLTDFTISSHFTTSVQKPDRLGDGKDCF